MKKWLFIALALLIVVPALGFGAWTWMTLSYSFSDGDRTGLLQKFSHKGWICKTWEGEILLASQPGVAPTMFAFSVRDEAVANQLRQLSGERITLSYAQHRGIPTSCFGETEYFITAVKKAPEKP